MGCGAGQSSQSVSQPQPHKPHTEQTKPNQTHQHTGLNQEEPNQDSTCSLLTDSATYSKYMEQKPIAEAHPFVNLPVLNQKSVFPSSDLSANEKVSRQNKEQSGKSVHELIANKKQQQNKIKEKKIEKDDKTTIRKKDVKKLLEEFGCNISDLDQSEYIQKLENFMKNNPVSQFYSGSDEVPFVKKQESQQNKIAPVSSNKKEYVPSSVESFNFGNNLTGAFEVVNNKDITLNVKEQKKGQYDTSIVLERNINPYCKYYSILENLGLQNIIDPNLSKKIIPNNINSSAQYQQTSNKNQQSSVVPYIISSQSDQPNMKIIQPELSSDKKNYQEQKELLSAHYQSLKFLTDKLNNLESVNNTNCIQTARYTCNVFQDRVI